MFGSARSKLDKNQVRQDNETRGDRDKRWYFLELHSNAESHLDAQSRSHACSESEKLGKKLLPRGQTS